MDDVELERIRARALAASPGPWFVSYLDDEHAMNLVAISTNQELDHARWPDFDHGQLVAATLIQQPATSM